MYLSILNLISTLLYHKLKHNTQIFKCSIFLSYLWISTLLWRGSDYALCPYLSVNSPSSSPLLTHHICVKICQFLLFCFMFQSPAAPAVRHRYLARHMTWEEPEPAPAIYLIAHNTGEDEPSVWAADQPSSSYLLSLSRPVIPSSPGTRRRDFADNFDSCRCWRTLQVNSPADLLNINDCLSDAGKILRM